MLSYLNTENIYYTSKMIHSFCCSSDRSSTNKNMVISVFKELTRKQELNITSLASWISCENVFYLTGVITANYCHLPWNPSLNPIKSVIWALWLPTLNETLQNNGDSFTEATWERQTERQKKSTRSEPAANELLKRTVISSAELDSLWPQRGQPHTSILSEDVARAPTGCAALNAAVLVIAITSQVSPSVPVQLEATVGPNLEQRCCRTCGWSRWRRKYCRGEHI